jgi:hypothetical protein
MNSIWKLKVIECHKCSTLMRAVYGSGNFKGEDIYLASRTLRFFHYIIFLQTLDGAIACRGCALVTHISHVAPLGTLGQRGHMAAVFGIQITVHNKPFSFFFSPSLSSSHIIVRRFHLLSFYYYYFFYFLSAWLKGEQAVAAEAWAEVLATDPFDPLALRLIHDAYFFRGDFGPMLQVFSLSLSLSLSVSICCLKNVSALWDALDVTFASSAQSYPVHLVCPLMKISILWLVMLVDCMLLFMVGVDR